jgi:hypothetical protein
MEYAIFDTESDMYVTSNWPENMCHKILKLWANNHPKLNMTRFELRYRSYDDLNYDNSAILVIDKDSRRIACYFHWRNKGYAKAFDPDKYFFVKYSPSNNKDITEEKVRCNNEKWDGNGEILK